MLYNDDLMEIIFLLIAHNLKRGAIDMGEEERIGRVLDAAGVSISTNNWSDFIDKLTSIRNKYLLEYLEE